MKRRPLDFRSIDEVIADLDRLQKHGYRKGGNWGLGQACHHLADFVRDSLDGFSTPRPPWYMRLIAPLAVWWMLRTRRMPEGVRAPAPSQPADEADDGREAEELKRLLLRFKEHKGPLHPSPFAGDFRYETWFQMHLIHCAHHLSFLHPAGGEAAA